MIAAKHFSGIDMDQGIWARLNPFEHSGHTALGLSLSSPVLVLSRLEIHGVPQFRLCMYIVNIYIIYILMDRRRIIFIVDFLDCIQEEGCINL